MLARLVAEAPAHVAPDGALALEVGEGQAGWLIELLARAAGARRARSATCRAWSASWWRMRLPRSRGARLLTGILVAAAAIVAVVLLTREPEPLGTRAGRATSHPRTPSWSAWAWARS